MPETVYVCQEYRPPESSHYGATGDWVVAGVVTDEQDAELWMEGHNHSERQYFETTLNMVEARHT